MWGRFPFQRQQYWRRWNCRSCSWRPANRDICDRKRRRQRHCETQRREGGRDWVSSHIKLERHSFLLFGPGDILKLKLINSKNNFLSFSVWKAGLEAKQCDGEGELELTRRLERPGNDPDFQLQVNKKLRYEIVIKVFLWDRSSDNPWDDFGFDFDFGRNILSIEYTCTRE